MIRRTHTRRTTHRRAFTIVELMVVTVVVLILMSILVAASSIATDTVRAAKAQGDHMTQERAILALLRRDLQYDHFFAEDSKQTTPTSGRRLSDQRTNDLVVSGTQLTGYTPPLAGYFLASSQPTPQTNPTVWDPSNRATWNFSEGVDSESLSSSRSGTHFLQFTIVVPGGATENRLTADVPFQNPSNSPSYPVIGTCAEVAYFLVPIGTTTPNGVVGKYKLVRRQKLAARNNDDKFAYSDLVSKALTSDTRSPKDDPSEVIAGIATGASYTGGAPYPFNVFNMNELTLATNRFGGASGGAWAPIAATGYRFGEDVLHNNVTSFEIKFTGPQANNVAWPSPDTSTVWPRPFSVAGALVNTDYPYDNLPFDGNYDTFNQGAGWNQATNLATSTTTTKPLKKLRITGAMIRLRCWSPATKTTRQTTMQVDL